MNIQQWLALTVEDALEPDLPIVDSHHHIWPDSPADPYPAYTMDALFQDKAASGHNIIATVYVDSHASHRTSGPEELKVVGETDYAERVAQEGNRRGGRFAGVCAAIVPPANLCLGARVGAVLDAHMAASPRMRGIRHMTAFAAEIPPVYGAGEAGIMLRPDFRAGFAELAPRKLNFDAWLFQHQLPEFVDLARAFPGTSIVLEHLGGPQGIGRYVGRREEAFAEWKRNMMDAAHCDNVVLKLGTLNMSYTGVHGVGEPRPRTSEEMARAQRDYILTAIDIFGPDRCMFESNFPVDMLGTSYNVLWNCFKRVTTGFTPAERTNLFSAVAIRTYRLAL